MDVPRMRLRRDPGTEAGVEHGAGCVLKPVLKDRIPQITASFESRRRCSAHLVRIGRGPKKAVRAKPGFGKGDPRPNSGGAVQSAINREHRNPSWGIRPLPHHGVAVASEQDSRSRIERGQPIKIVRANANGLVQVAN